MADRIPHPFYENAYLYKQPKSKFWTMDYKNADGKRTRKSSKKTDKNEAIKVLSENLMLIEKVRSGEITLTNQSKNTVNKAVKETIRYYESLTLQKPVYKNYKRLLNNFADKYGNLPIESVNRKVLREHLNQNYSRAVLDNIKTSLKTMFIICEDNGYIDRSPEFPTGITTKKSKLRVGIDKKQVEILIKRFMEKSLNSKFEGKRRVSSPVEMENARICAIAIMLLYYTGARIGEIKKLKGEDFFYKKVDGEMRTYMEIKHSKTRERIILIPINLFATIKRHLADNDISDTNYIFMNRIENKIPSDITKIVKRDLECNREFYKSIGLQDFVLYQLRHTFIIEKLSQNKNVYIVAKHCGTSVSMIEKNYASYIVASSYDQIYRLEDQTKLFND